MRTTAAAPTRVDTLAIGAAAALSAERVLAILGSGPDGLDDAAVAGRRASVGTNAVRTHRVSALAVLARQLRSALLGLLAAAALVSFFVGERTDAVVIAVIVSISVGFGFVNEYRAERAGAALHDRIKYTAVVTRAGEVRRVDVTDLVPGDLVRLDLGMVVPADIRLLAGQGLECDESVLTGESAEVPKSTTAVEAGTPLAELASCALMGTVVRAGEGTGVHHGALEGHRAEIPERRAGGDRLGRFRHRQRLAGQHRLVTFQVGHADQPEVGRHQHAQLQVHQIARRQPGHVELAG